MMCVGCLMAIWENRSNSLLLFGMRRFWSCLIVGLYIIPLMHVFMTMGGSSSQPCWGSDECKMLYLSNFLIKASMRNLLLQ